MTDSSAFGLSPLRVLLLDNDPRTREIVGRVLELRGHVVDPATDCQSVDARLSNRDYEVALVDVDHCGQQVLPQLVGDQTLNRQMRVIAMSETPRADVLCLRKPFNADQLFSIVEAFPPEDRKGTRLLGRSQQMQRVHELIERVAPTRATVLIQGETGTGK